MLEKLVKLIAGAAATISIARHLGPEEFGVLALALSITAVLSQLTTLGLNALLIRDFATGDTAAPTTLVVAGTLRLVAGLAVTVAVLLTFAMYLPDRASLSEMIIVLSVSNVFRAGEVFEQYALSQGRARVPVLGRILASLTLLVTAALLVLSNAQLGYFVIPRALEVVVMNVVFAASYYRILLRHDASRFDGSHARSLLGRSWPLILSGFGATLNLRADQVMLGALASASEVGIYAAAVQLSEVWYFVPVAAMTAAFPTVVKARTRDPNTYYQHLQLAYDTMLWGAVAVAAVIAAASPHVIALVYGSAYAGAESVLTLHVWAGVFVATRAVLSKWILAEDLAIVSLLTHALGATANIALNLLLIPHFGAIGAATGTIVSYSIASYLGLMLWRRTRPQAWMMSLAFVAPFRWLRRIVCARERG